MTFQMRSRPVPCCVFAVHISGAAQGRNGVFGTNYWNNKEIILDRCIFSFITEDGGYMDRQILRFLHRKGV